MILGAFWRSRDNLEGVLNGKSEDELGMGDGTSIDGLGKSWRWVI